MAVSILPSTQPGIRSTIIGGTVIGSTTVASTIIGSISSIGSIGSSGSMGSVSRISSGGIDLTFSTACSSRIHSG
jgi:hypothetical protein